MIQNLDGEIWKPVVDLEDYYSVSNLGRVRREAVTIECANGGQRFYKAKIMTQHLWKNKRTPTEYFRVELVHKVADINRHINVHLLVAKAFIGEPKGREVLHRDGNLLNNNSDNLKYGQHGILSELNEEQLGLVKNMALSTRAAAKMLGITKSSVQRWRKLLGLTKSRLCSIADCENIMDAIGLCNKHYQSQRLAKIKSENK